MREAPKVTELVDIQKIVEEGKFNLGRFKDPKILEHVRLPDEEKFSALVEKQEKYIRNFYALMKAEALKDFHYTEKEKTQVKLRIEELEEKELMSHWEKSALLLTDLRRLRDRQIEVRVLSKETATEMTRQIHGKETRQEYESGELWSIAEDILGQIGFRMEEDEIQAILPGKENIEAYMESINFFRSSFYEDLDLDEIKYHLQNIRKLLMEKRRLETNITQIHEVILNDRVEKEISEAELEKTMFDILKSGGVFRGQKNQLASSENIQKLNEILRNDINWNNLKDLIRIFKPLTVIPGKQIGDFMILVSRHGTIQIVSFNFKIPFELQPTEEQEKIVESRMIEFRDIVLRGSINNLLLINAMPAFLLGEFEASKEVKMLFEEYKNAYLQYLNDTNSPHTEEIAKEDFELAGEKFRKFAIASLNERLNNLTNGRSYEDLSNLEINNLFEKLHDPISLHIAFMANEYCYDFSAWSSLDSNSLTGFDLALMESVQLISKFANNEGQKNTIQRSMELWALHKSIQGVQEF